MQQKMHQNATHCIKNATKMQQIATNCIKMQQKPIYNATKHAS